MCLEIAETLVVHFQPTPSCMFIYIDLQPVLHASNVHTIVGAEYWNVSATECLQELLPYVSPFVPVVGFRINRLTVCNNGWHNASTGIAFSS